MKCYSYIYLFVLVFFSAFSTQGQIPNVTTSKAITPSTVEMIESIDLVVPLKDHEIESGELYKVRVISSKSYDDLLKFKNTRINEIMFVTEIIDSELDGLLFEVFVTTPPKGKKDKEKEYSFRYEKFNYKNNKKDLQGDMKTLAVDNPFDFSDLNLYLKYQWLAVFILILVLILCFYLIKKLLRSRKKKKNFRLEAKRLIEKIENSKSKNDFESVYLEKEKIREYVDIDEKAFVKFLSRINDYQFQKEWKEEFSKELIALKKDLDIRGINRGI